MEAAFLHLRSSAAWEAVGQPQVWIHPDTLGEYLSSGNTEMINRPAVGLSEYASVLDNLVLVLEEGLEKKLFHPELVGKFKALHSKYDLGTAAKVLNTVGYPHQARAESDVSRAVTNVLKFGQDLRQEWTVWADFFGRCTAMTVGFSWSLTMAALTNGSVFAAKLKDVPVKSAVAKSDFLANPLDGRKLKTFLIAEVLDLNGLRATSPATSSAAPVFQAMSFDSEDDDEAGSVVTAADPAALQKGAVQKSVQKLLSLKFPVGVTSDVWPAESSVKSFEKLLASLPSKVNESLAALANLDAAAAFAVAREPIVAHVKSLKRKLKEYREA